MPQEEEEDTGRMRNPLKLKAILIDLNGTLHVGNQPTSKAVEALRKLRRAKLPLIFCSNSTKESTRHLLKGLGDMGFDVKEKELLTSLGACRALVEQRKLKPFLLLSTSAKEEFGSQSENNDEDYDSVILGLDPPSLSYELLNKAFRILKNEPITHDSAHTTQSNSKSKKVSLIAPHASLYQQSPATDGLPAGLSLGIGPFVKALELSSGVEAELVGKPTRRFFELAIQRVEEMYGKIEGNIGIIGDDVVNDLGDGAREIGLKRILVRTGKYREGVEGDHQPDKVYDDFAHFVDDLVD